MLNQIQELLVKYRAYFSHEELLLHLHIFAQNPI